ncbi:MAG: T9SS type A sorting domain-containing protein [Bacteroidetes bacterium]|nr:T9SS type A sorting domain-containing protein [Bacteroidota bacterium]
MKKIIVFFSLFIVPLFGTAQIVNIPDANFKAYLVGEPTINTNSDGEIQVTEASAFTGAIVVSSLSISDLTGIEAFTALTELWCDNNSLTSLDVSQNTALTYLNSNNNSLTGLDISNNTALTYLDCDSNSLTSLDVRNGNNYNMVYAVWPNPPGGFSATGNPLLNCILVDDTVYSNANWSLNKDAIAVYSNDCTVGIKDNEPNQPTITTQNNTIIIASVDGRVSIYNLLGQEVHKANLPASIQINESGVYLVRVDSGGKHFTKKVVLSGN